MPVQSSVRRGSRAEPPPVHRLAAAGAALLLLIVGCTGPGEVRREREEREEQSRQMLRELLEQGTIRPVGSMGDPYAAVDPAMEPTPEERARASTEPELEGEATRERPTVPPLHRPAAHFNPWSEFGPRIAFDPATGFVTKPYPLRPGMGEKILELVQEYGDFRFYDPEAGPQERDQLDLVLKKGFDVEAITKDLRSAQHLTGLPIVVADWLIARGDAEVLHDFEYFLNTFLASPPQIEIEAKIVEVVTRDTFDMGVSDFLASFPEKVAVDAIGFHLPNRTVNELLLGVGTIRDGVQYSALLELLSTFENVSIISRPRSAVREGGRARVEAVERIPYLEVVSVTAQGGITTTLKYLEVGVRLFVTPRLVGSKVALEIDVEASQQTGDVTTATSAEGEIITTPILSTRKARTLVYLRPGQAVILGGLITERVVDSERKVPFLGDIPGLGILFRSTFQSKGKAHVLFFIRPRVMQGADLSYEF